MSEFKLHSEPMVDVCVDPANAVDAKTRRLLDKELGAAFGTNRTRWIRHASQAQGAGPTIFLSCEGDKDASAIALQLRIGLAHFVFSVRRRLPQWVVQFRARGKDGGLLLEWGIDVGSQEVARSLLGRVVKPQVHESEGRRFWNERDGGISLLKPGSWTWDPAISAWQTFRH